MAILRKKRPAAACGGLRRLVFSSTVPKFGPAAIPGPGHRSIKGRINAALRFVFESLFTALFPADCRLCHAPLCDFSRLPVCSDCLAQLKSFEGDVCSVCGEILPSRATVKVMECAACRNVKPAFARAVAHGPYEGRLRELLHLLKYDGVRSAAHPLGGVLAAKLRALALEEKPLVIPVPLHRRKFTARGFNQAEEICRAARRLLKFDLGMHVLVRRRDTGSQTGLTPLQRRDNVRGSFAIRARAIREVKGRLIVLVDDVLTTGATANECARVLRKAGAKKVYVATIARVARSEARIAPITSESAAAGF